MKLLPFPIKFLLFSTADYLTLSNNKMNQIRRTLHVIRMNLHLTRGDSELFKGFKQNNNITKSVAVFQGESQTILELTFMSFHQRLIKSQKRRKQYIFFLPYPLAWDNLLFGRLCQPYSTETMCIRILVMYFLFRANNLHCSDLKEGESE